VVVWLCWITAMLAATVQVARGPVGSGYGWGAALASAVLVAAPLLVLGLAVVIVVFVLLALVGNWSGQSATDNTVDAVVSALAISACAGAWILEVPLLGRRPR
jgi:hypothetical protein